MSIKSMSPGVKQNGMEPQDEKSAATLESSQITAGNAKPSPRGGKPNTPQNVNAPVMTVDQAADLLARLQDILATWPGSDNKIFEGYVMTVFPIPAGMLIDKVMTKDLKGKPGKVYTVNGAPVVSLGHDSLPGHDNKESQE